MSLLPWGWLQQRLAASHNREKIELADEIYYVSCTRRLVQPKIFQERLWRQCRSKLGDGRQLWLCEHAFLTKTDHRPLATSLHRSTAGAAPGAWQRYVRLCLQRTKVTAVPLWSSEFLPRAAFWFIQRFGDAASIFGIHINPQDHNPNSHRCDNPNSYINYDSLLFVRRPRFSMDRSAKESVSQSMLFVTINISLPITENLNMYE
jgi:hypothetical protein